MSDETPVTEQPQVYTPVETSPEQRASIVGICAVRTYEQLALRCGPDVAALITGSIYGQPSTLTLIYENRV